MDTVGQKGQADSVRWNYLNGSWRWWHMTQECLVIVALEGLTVDYQGPARETGPYGTCVACGKAYDKH